MRGGRSEWGEVTCEVWEEGVPISAGISRRLFSPALRCCRFTRILQGERGRRGRGVTYLDNRSNCTAHHSP